MRGPRRLSSGTEWLRRQRAGAATPLRRLRLLAPLSGILIVAQAWLLAHLIDAVAFRQAGLDGVWPEMAALLPVFGLRFVLDWLGARLGFEAARRVKTGVRRRLLTQLRRLGPAALENDSSGDLAARLVDGVEALDGYFSRYQPALVLMTVVPLVVLLAVFPSDWLSGLVLLLTAPLVPLFMALIGRGAERRNQAQWKLLRRMGAHFLNVIQTLPTRRAFNASRRELHHIARISESFRQATMSVLYLAFLTSAVLEFFAAISIAIVAVFIGFRLLDGGMDFFHGLFVLLLAPEFYQPLRNFGVQNHARMEAAAAAEQIAELLDRPAPALPVAGEDPLPAHGALELKGVRYAYEGQRQALDGLDLRIREGERIAIVGRSGAGKSTLAALLLGFIRPDEGAIRYGGQPLEPQHLAAWRRRIGWIPQRPHLFHGSLLDNIRLGAPEADREQVRAACEAAHALAFIERLPEGLDTRVGDGGRPLSGGEAQRIALARALLRDPAWLLLDEPAAHLDPEHERWLDETLNGLARDHTLITIAHRLPGTRHADRILVMQDGRLAQAGDYATLSRAPGPFRDLLRAGGLEAA